MLLFFAISARTRVFRSFSFWTSFWSPCPFGALESAMMALCRAAKRTRRLFPRSSYVGCSAPSSLQALQINRILDSKCDHDLADPTVLAFSARHLGGITVWCTFKIDNINNSFVPGCLIAQDGNCTSYADLYATCTVLVRSPVKYASRIFASGCLAYREASSPASRMIRAEANSFRRMWLCD